MRGKGVRGLFVGTDRVVVGKTDAMALFNVLGCN